MSSAYYRSIKYDREKKLRDYRKRKSQLEDIRQDLFCDFENNASDINDKCVRVSEKITDGIQIYGGSAAASSMWRQIDNGRSDWDMSSCLNNISSEHCRVCQKISELEKEISKLEGKIRQAEEAERQEAMEKLKNMLGVN